MMPTSVKLCTKCRKWKKVPTGNWKSINRRYWLKNSDFPKVKSKLKGGKTSTLISSHCYECKQKASKSWRKKKKKEGISSDIYRQYRQTEIEKDPEAYYRRKKESSDAYLAKNRDKIRKKQREKAAIKRREEGRPIRGGWAKYREEENGSGAAAVYLLPIEPIQQYLIRLDIEHGLDSREIANLTGVDISLINKLITGKDGSIKDGIKRTVSESAVDKIFLGMHEPHMFNELYPVDE